MAGVQHARLIEGCLNISCSMITNADQDLLQKKGISEAKFNEQLACFVKGFPYLKLAAAASVEHGILSPNADEEAAYLAAWQNYKADTNHRVVKFVPASGAASRMFKDMFAFVDAPYNEPTTDFEKQFFARIHDAAFFADLEAACQRIYAAGIDTLVQNGRYKDCLLYTSPSPRDA